MSMLWRLRKVLLSRGVSMFDGWAMGSHIMTTQVSGGSLNPHSTCAGQPLYTF
ncbi:hypothetical protein M9458_026410, partial [Cirrhinus mrigala]